MKKAFFTLALLLSIGICAQSGSKKPHYEIINPESEIFLKYEKALTHTEFDGLRFLNQRRQIPIDGSKIIIELYSAQELLEKYGKKISLLTVKNYLGTKQVKLKLADNNYRMVVMEFHEKIGWVPVIGKEMNSGNKGLPPAPTGSDCATTDPFCTGTNYQFPASTSTTAEPGYDYGCLSSQPNPAWYYMQVATSGVIIINIAGTAGQDVDFICWGPYASPTAMCGTSVSGNIVDCSYSSSATETCTINNAVAGQFYLLLLTNFSGVVQDITFGSDPSSTGATNCGIVCGLTASSTGPYCIGQTINLNSTLVTAATYTWTGPGGFNANTQNATIPNATVGMSGTYTVTATNANGPCTSTVSVNVSAGPTVSVTPSSTICVGANAILTASGATSYTWVPGGATTNTISVSPPSTAVYTVSGTTGNCPVTNATSTVTVTTPTTIAVNSATICPTISATLTATNGSTYSWLPPTGLSASTGSMVVASPASTTVYTVSSPGGCFTSGTCTVTVTPPCNITVNSATLCANTTATLTANGGGPYAWAPATGLSATSGASVFANPAVTTIYTVTSTSPGFTTTATSTVVVSASPTISVNNATICEGTSTSLISHGASTYTWAPATGLSATTASAVVASPTVTTTYTITGTAINSCTNAAIATIGVNAMPTVSVTPTGSSGCEPLCVNFASASSTSSLNYSWDFGDGGSSVAPNPTNCFRYKGIYKTTLTLTDGNGCKGKAVSTETVYPHPNADFGASPQPVSILEPTIQFTDLTTNGIIVKWNWDFGAWETAADTSHFKNPKYTYQDTGYFIVNLWVSTQFGCKDSVTKIIKIDDDYELFVPTAFTPNGDGINEYFLPVTRGVVTSNYHLYLYDRWGNLVFQTDNLYKGWDGTIHGSVVQEDVFVWKVLLKTTNGTVKQVHGQVSVVK